MVNRKLGGDPYCTSCRMKLENTPHPFFECALVAQVWGASPFSVVLLSEWGSFVSWFHFLRSKLENEVFNAVVVVGQSGGS